jgi:hypothetical protein
MIFRSTDHALRFAYSLAERPICKTSSLASWRGKEHSVSLTPYEHQAQAVMIRNCVDRLQAVERAYIHARYAHGGEYRWDGTLNVAKWLQQQHGDISLGAHRLMVEQYVTGGGGSRKIQAAMKARRATVLSAIREVYKRLDALHERAIGQLHEYFLEKELPTFNAPWPTRSGQRDKKLDGSLEGSWPDG